MLVHAVIRCPGDTPSTYICPMEIYYTVWVYIWIPDMQSDDLLLRYGQGQRLRQCQNA